jgi:heterodisulfide reductase subunit A-like polyferredoxin
LDPHNVPDAKHVFQALDLLGFINPVRSLLTPPKHKEASLRDTQATVVVVGAGFAGICAAKKLESDGFRVVVLEASDRIGGR